MRDVGIIEDAAVAVSVPAPGRAAGAYAVCDLDDRRLVINVFGAEPQRYQLERS